MVLIPTLTLNMVIKKVGWRKTVLSRCLISSYHTTSPMRCRYRRMSWRSSLPRPARCLRWESLLRRYWRSIMPRGTCRSSACKYQTQHFKADASESQQTPAASHVTCAIPGEVAGIGVTFSKCDQKCSVSPQLSHCQHAALTALPCLSSGNGLPGASEKLG